MMDLFFLRTWYVHRALRNIHLQPGSMLLDAGTGFGQYAWHMIRKYPGVRVTATDLKKDYLDRASRTFDAFGLSNHIHFQIDDLTDPQISEKFDCILAVDVLEHIVDDDAAIGHFYQRLSPGGHLIISTPSDQGGSDVHHSDQKSFIGEHVRDGYNLQELHQKLAQAGLKVIQEEYSYGRWGSIAWRLLIKLPILLLGKSMFFAPLIALYYIPILPLGLVMNLVDLNQINDSGTGLMITARKRA